MTHRLVYIARALPWIVLATAWSGCYRSVLVPENSVEIDGGPAGDAGSPPGDGGRDSSMDAGPDSSTAMADASIDASRDGATATDDASVDSGTDASTGCGPCTSSGPCARAACVDGQCVETFVADGTLCDEQGLHLCLAHACVVRECGDGWLEPGPNPPEERCDDGNRLDGDGCDSTCRIGPVVVDADPMDSYISTPTLGARAIGVDGQGRTLFVWIRDAIDHEEIHALRVGPYGAESFGDSIVLEPMLLAPSHADPTVIGLRDGGWIVAWSAIRTTTRDIVFRRVASDGTVGPEIVANRQRAGQQTRPSLARVGGGFAVAWVSDYDTEADPHGGVYGRVFGADGNGLTTELAIAADRVGIESAVVLSGTDTGFVAAFTQGRFADSLRPTVRARRFGPSSAVDRSDLVLTGLDADQPAIACRGDGFCVVAYRDRSRDPSGDVSIQRIPPSGAIEGVVTPVAATPAHLEQRPAVTTTPTGGLLVAWEDASPGLVAYALLPTEPLGSEATTLSALLDGRAYGDVSLTTAPRGVWFALTAEVPGHSLESFTAFFLPLSHTP